MINIKVQGVKDVEIFLKRLDENLQNVYDPLEKSARYMENQARANFSAKGRVMGEGWKKLAPSTERRKAKSGRPMMVETGLLKSSFMPLGPRTSKDGGEVEVYNPVSYAIKHQEGMGKLPRRVLLKFMKTHIMEISRIFETWVGRIINRS